MTIRSRAALLALIATPVFALTAAVAGEGAVNVELRGEPGAWRLFRGGQPFFIHGAGGGGDKALLKSIGGNSFRTWGIGAKTGAELDGAQELGLTVTVGFWLGHAAHGFDYNNAEQLEKQKADVRRGLEKFKDHPAVLAWAMGNEMEIGVNNPEALWRHVNDLAKMAKEIDPNHPVMTIVADFDQKKIQDIHRWCPDVDIIGINTYGGGPSAAKRYREAGGTKAMALTEYGPNGTWEWRNTSWNAPLELSSTEKAEQFYRKTYADSIEAEKGKFSVGGYCFTWGYKVEGTPTWYGMLYPTADGDVRLGVCDVMQKFWTGQDPENPCPRVTGFTADTDVSKALKAGQAFKATLAFEMPKGQAPARIEFELFKDSKEYRPYQGHGMPMPPSFPEAIGAVEGGVATITMPDEPGPYFLYGRVFDDTRGAALAMIPLLVEGVQKAGPPRVWAPKPTLPLVVVGDDVGDPMPYIASGYMGNTAAIAMNPNSTEEPYAGETCMKVEYKAAGNWAGVFWQSPANDWGDAAGGFDLSDAKKLVFHARGAQGGEKVKFFFGGIDQKKPHYDTAKSEIEVTLSKAWKEFSLDLAGEDLRRIKSGFGWSLGGAKEPVTFYLDDVRYE